VRAANPAAHPGRQGAADADHSGGYVIGADDPMPCRWEPVGQRLRAYAEPHLESGVGRRSDVRGICVPRSSDGSTAARL